MPNDKQITDIETLKQVLDMTGMLVVVLDREGRIIYFNPNCQHATGYDGDQLLHKKMSETLVKKSQLKDFEFLLQQVSEGHTRIHEGFWCVKDQSHYICVHSTITSIGTDPARAPWITITGIDVTGKKRMEEALLNSEARLRAIHDAAVDGIITIDEQGIIESLNSAAADMFGYSSEELVGTNIKVLMPSPDHERHDDYLRHFLDTGIPRIIGRGREVTALHKDRTTFPIELAVSEVEMANRRMFTGILRDITERRRVEQAAHLRLTEHAHASRLAALGEMASGIAHELNQPLAAIVSFADACKRMLSSGSGRPDVIEGALVQIAQQGERAGNIIRRLREFVRKGKIERENTDINTLIDDVLEIMDHDLRMRQVTVQREFHPDLPLINIDKLQIEQVILNLIRNAIDAMETSAEQRLTIRTELEDHSIKVSVLDTGCGFPANQARQLFDAFYTTKSEGTGLGLSISYSIISAHSGTMTANSDDAGATFTFSLPVT